MLTSTVMKRWGHVEGTGIGARADGIVHALSAEHASKPMTDPSTLSKRQQAKLKAASANAKKRKWIQAPNARGRIVNANEDQRAAEEKGRLGETSRVVCLTGLVEGEDEVDEELSEEVGAECSKWGIVERVLLHMVEPPPEKGSDCLRVFVVFSGLAGAWRAAKELDGRIFGGKKIVSFKWVTDMGSGTEALMYQGVRYFDEDKFNAGDRDGSLA
jgi:splicing factor 45